MACLTPYYVHKARLLSHEKVPVPCGKCPQCMKRRISGWSYRLVKEGERSSSSLFVTLTYDTDNVPLSKAGYMTLDKTEIPRYMKRLRKLEKGKRLKYYACGEYGGKRWRPHYHAIIFNADPLNIEKAWSLDGKMLGGVFIGTDCSEAAIGYVLKYMSKEPKIPQHRNDDRQAEFSLMSKGIGSNYLTEKMIQWHLKNPAERMYVNLPGNKKIAMPRYYKDKIFDDTTKSIVSVHMRHVKERLEAMQRLKDGSNYEWNLIQSTIHQFKKAAKHAEFGREKLSDTKFYQNEKAKLERQGERIRVPQKYGGKQRTVDDGSGSNNVNEGDPSQIQPGATDTSQRKDPAVPC